MLPILQNVIEDEKPARQEKSFARVTKISYDYFKHNSKKEIMEKLIYKTKQQMGAAAAAHAADEPLEVGGVGQDDHHRAAPGADHPLVVEALTFDLGLGLGQHRGATLSGIHLRSLFLRQLLASLDRSHFCSPCGC